MTKQEMIAVPISSLNESETGAKNFKPAQLQIRDFVSKQAGKIEIGSYLVLASSSSSASDNWRQEMTQRCQIGTEVI